MRQFNLSCNLKITMLLLIALMFLLSGCRKSLTVTFPPAGEQSVTGTDIEGEENPNLIKADECYDQGDYASALEHLEAALEERTKAYGTGHTSLTPILNKMGEAYLGLGDIENALSYFEQALVINQETSSMDTDTAVIFTNIGRAYTEFGDYEQALINLNAALSLYSTLGGEESREAAIVCGDIAMVYQNSGDFDKALECHNRELVIEQKVCGEVSKEVGVTYINIGQLYSRFQKYSQALDYFEKANTICEQVWGVDHYYWGKVNHNIGGVYYDLKEYNKSVEYIKNALTVYEKQPITYQYSLAKTCTTLALDYYYLDKMDFSLQYGVKAYQSILAYPYATVSEVQEYKDNLERIYTESGNDPAVFEQWLVSQ